MSVSQDQTCPLCQLTPIRGIAEFGRSPTNLTPTCWDCPSCGLFDPSSQFRLDSDNCTSDRAQIRAILRDEADRGEPGGGGSTGKAKPAGAAARGAAIYEDDPNRWNGNSAAGIAAITITRLETKDKSTTVQLPVSIKADLQYVAKARKTSVAKLLEEAVSDHGADPTLTKVPKTGEETDGTRVWINSDRQIVLKAHAKALKMTFSGYLTACAKKFLEEMPKYD